MIDNRRKAHQSTYAFQGPRREGQNHLGLFIRIERHVDSKGPGRHKAEARVVGGVTNDYDDSMTQSPTDRKTFFDQL